MKIPKAGPADRIRKKLSSSSGESIAEVLAATVVVALGAILLAGMVTSSKNIILRSEKVYDDYLKERNYIETRGKSEPGSGDVRLDVRENDLITVKVGNGDGTSQDIPVSVTSVTAEKDGKVIFREYESNADREK